MTAATPSIGPPGMLVHEHGGGPGVLWLHGYTMDSLVWQVLWPHLPGYRHLGLDLPGHGGSRDLRPGEDLAALADEVALWAFGAGVAHVVGMSFGSILALELALRHPQLAASWVFAAPSIVGAPTEAAVELRYREIWQAYARHGPGPHLARLWMRPPPDVFAGVLARPAVAELVAQRVSRHRWAELANGRMRRLLDRDQDVMGLAALPEGALLVLVGERELPTHRAAAERLASAAPGARLAVVGTAGHLALLEEPATTAPLLLAHWRAARSAVDPPDEPG